MKITQKRVVFPRERQGWYKSFAAQLRRAGVKYNLYERWEFKDSFNVAEFYSHGRNGVVLKRVIFSKTRASEFYMLGFGSVDENNEINDLTVTNNGDTEKILATIYDIVINYTDRYPDRMIYFEGSTPARTRLYRRAIGLNLGDLSTEFFIYGYYNDEFVPFEKNMVISGFLIKRKK